ncbi:hypothetical protein H311_01314 [Anncaliia algerae PRA109]|nr:hypothetical protein H311_01314 [Anncaliia algerae PRA109]
MKESNTMKLFFVREKHIPYFLFKTHIFNIINTITSTVLNKPTPLSISSSFLTLFSSITFFIRFVQIFNTAFFIITTIIKIVESNLKRRIYNFKSYSNKHDRIIVFLLIFIIRK